jgi:hypothetical protein
VGAKLDEPDPVLDGLLQTSEEGAGLPRIGAGDELKLREPQGGDDGAVRRREEGWIHAVRMDPTKRLALKSPGHALMGMDPAHVEQHLPVPIIVGDPDQGAASDDPDPELLPELPD